MGADVADRLHGAMAMTGRRSFLGRLLSYAPRIGRSPDEDFFTEAFAGLIATDPLLLRHIFASVRGGNSVSLRDIDLPESTDNIRVDTQFRMRNGRPDIVLSWCGTPRLLIESKFAASFTVKWAEPDAGHLPGATPRTQEPTDAGIVRLQVPRYIDEVKAEGWPAKVLLVSLWPRDVGHVDTRVYAGNLLWYQVYEALAQAPPSATERGRVLRGELIDLMEERQMTPPVPLRFGDARTFWHHQDMRMRMAALLERVVAGLKAQFNLTASHGRTTSWSDYWLLTADGIAYDLGLVAAAREESDAPIWPILHIRPDPPSDTKRRICDVLSAEPSGIPGGGWPGLCAYPTSVELANFLQAPEWESQVRALTDIAVGWFAKIDAVTQQPKL